MTDKQIIEEVIRYIEDDAYNYAILIDGEWGCGKTYFIQHSLKDEIVKNEEEKEFSRKVKYVSLYGCKTVQDIQENIVWGMVEELPKKISKRRARTAEKEEKKRISDNVLLSSRKIGNALVKKFFPEVDTYTVITDWLVLKSYIFVFDDLERCACPLNEVFGFINGIVEHEGGKVIIVANEEEVSEKCVTTQEGVQYSILLDERIDWPRREQAFPLSRTSKDKRLDFAELEERRQWLFPEDAHAEYRKIREKVIGVTLKYEPNIRETIKAIVAGSEFEKEFVESLLKNIEYFYLTMNNYRHHNLRTFQFFLSKASYLMNRLSDIEIDSGYRELVRDTVLQECFRAAVIFKGDIQPPKDEWKKIYFDIGLKMKSIKDYVEKGEFLSERYRTDVEKYIEEECKMKISQEDPYSLLYNQYYVNTQAWCQERLEDIIRKLDQNEYPLFIYPKIIMCAVKLQELGFDEHYLERIKEKMLASISKMDTTERIDDDLWYVESREFKAKVSAVISEINEAVMHQEKKIRKKSINEILDSEQWLDGLEQYTNPNNEMYPRDIPVFSQVSVEKWISRLEMASSAEIDVFRRWLAKVYPSNVVKKSAEEDIDTIRGIWRSLNTENGDLIKNAIMGWLKNQIKAIIDLYISPEQDE